MAVLCMRDVSDHNYRNSPFIVDLAMGQIPRSTERISSFLHTLWQFSMKFNTFATVARDCFVFIW